MFRLLEPANHLTPPDASTVVLFGKRWVITEYAHISDAPPFTCISYAWGDEKERNPVYQDQVMSSRTIPTLETTISASQSQKSWAANIKFSYNSDLEKEEAGQAAALTASQALWIDTFCVPAKEPARTICLQSMGEIFSSAYQVIVVLTKQCSGVIRSIHQTGNLGASKIGTLEKEDWVSRAWTYQEAVNSRSLYFIVEGEDNTIVSGQDFLRAIVDAIEVYKQRHDLDNASWIKFHPRLYNLEALLADYLIADYSTRSAYQVMSAMDQRSAERADDIFYAMIGAISSAPEKIERAETLSPAEYFMRVCERKGDYSFIYSNAKRSKTAGQHWRPAKGKATAVLPNLITFGDNEAGIQEPSHLKLENMNRLKPGNINEDALKAARWFAGSKDEEMPKTDVAAKILKRLISLGFTGCGEYLEFETGFFFPHSKPEQSKDMLVVVSTEIHWVTGGPGLLLRSNNTDIKDFCDVGAFVGRNAKVGTSVKVG